MDPVKIEMGKRHFVIEFRPELVKGDPSIPHFVDGIEVAVLEYTEGGQFRGITFEETTGDYFEAIDVGYSRVKTAVKECKMLDYYEL